MIKYFMRKLYSEVDDATLDIISKLVFRWELVSVFSTLLCVLLLFSPYIIICIIYICAIISDIAFICVTLVYLLLVILSRNFLKKKLLDFSEELAVKIYFYTCTKSGKALLGKDFDTIKKANKYIYEHISEQECRGWCYWYSFNICKILKQGSLEFIAIKNFHYIDKNNVNEVSDNKFTMHAIYVNNDWAFDPYSVRQWPICKLREIWQAIPYKTFSFMDIRDLPYDEFCSQIGGDLAKWCADNDCYQEFTSN